MNILKMNKEDFYSIPTIGWDEDIGTFDYLVILPKDEMHDSGFATMDFVLVKKLEPICRISGGSDVIHIDGIGGYGILGAGWKIDCLPCGLLRLWNDEGITVGLALSDYEVYSKKQ